MKLSLNSGRERLISLLTKKYMNCGPTITEASHFNMGYKLFSKILHELLQPYVQQIVGNYQCGFCVGKSTIDEMQSMSKFMGGGEQI